MGLADEIAEVLDDSNDDWKKVVRLRQAHQSPKDGGLAIPITELGELIDVIVGRIAGLQQAVMRLAEEFEKK